jgi:hypothetical protein
MAEAVKIAKEERIVVIREGQATTEIKLGKTYDDHSVKITQLNDSEGTCRVLYRNQGAAFAFFVHPLDGGLSISCGRITALAGEDTLSISHGGVTTTVLHDKLASVNYTNYTLYPANIRPVGNKVIVEAYDIKNAKIGEVEISESEMKVGDKMVVFETRPLQKRG